MTALHDWNDTIYQHVRFRHSRFSLNNDQYLFNKLTICSTYENKIGIVIFDSSILSALELLCLFIDVAYWCLDEDAITLISDGTITVDRRLDTLSIHATWLERIFPCWIHCLSRYGQGIVGVIVEGKLGFEWFLYSSVLWKNSFVSFIIILNTSTIARGTWYIFTCKRVVCFN